MRRATRRRLAASTLFPHVPWVRRCPAFGVLPWHAYRLATLNPVQCFAKHFAFPPSVEVALKKGDGAGSMATDLGELIFMLLFC